MSQIGYSVSRSRNGILFTIEAIPQVEEFFSVDHQVNGEISPVNLFGRLWQPTSGGDLNIYPLAPGLSGNIVTTHPSEVIRLDRPGNILLDDPAVGCSVNLSVLRLKGISDPNGVTLRYDGVFTADFLREFLRRYQEASVRFYNAFLTPVRLSGRIMKED